MRSDQRTALKEIFGQLAVSTDARRANRMLGMALILLTEVLGYTAVQAWRIVRPESTANDASAAVIVRRRKAFHRKHYPLAINEALDVHGITIERLIGKLEAMLEAKKVQWDEATKSYVESKLPDYRIQDRAIGKLLQIVNLDKVVRQEMAIGREEMAKMRLETGMKFDSTKDWIDYMARREQEIIASRAEAARDMKLIAEGRRILKEEGTEAADAMRAAAVEAGLNGEGVEEHGPDGDFDR